MADPELKKRLGRLGRRLAARDAGHLESRGEAAEAPLRLDSVREAVDRCGAELNRIVSEYLDDGERERKIVADLLDRGRGAIRLLESNRRRFERQPEAISALEAIVNPDGSRPSFLIREGIVDQRSSPLGSWGTLLDTDSNDLEKTIACIGRIDDPSLPGGYAGTGVLIHEDVILTNRHVVQQIARQQTDRTWKLNDRTAIDFGREYRGWPSVGPRRLQSVVFIGSSPIDPYNVDHSKLDLAAIQLESVAAADRPRYVLSLDAATGWIQAPQPIYAIGYPYKPEAGQYSPTLLEELFETQFGSKRLAPGHTVAPRRATPRDTATHDATTLGGNSGSAVVQAGRPFSVLAVHYGGSKNEPAENWCHAIGPALALRGEAGEKLVETLARYRVAINHP